MKVVVLTTSYPDRRAPGGGQLRRGVGRSGADAGIDVEVVSPGSFPHFGVALGAGIVQNLRAAPWRLAFVPGFLAAFSLAARRAARDADLVHAHWIPSAVAARATGKPYVLQVWGTDVSSPVVPRGSCVRSFAARGSCSPLHRSWPMRRVRSERVR